MLVSAAVIDTHAEAFLRQAQNSQTFLDQLPIRVGEMWDQWDNFDIFACFGKLADTFKVR